MVQSRLPPCPELYAPDSLPDRPPDHIFPDSIPQIHYLIGLPLWILQYDLNPEIDQENPQAGILKFSSIILSLQPNTGSQGNDYQ